MCFNTSTRSYRRKCIWQMSWKQKSRPRLHVKTATTFSNVSGLNCPIFRLRWKHRQQQADGTFSSLKSSSWDSKFQVLWVKTELNFILDGLAKTIGDKGHPAQTMHPTGLPWNWVETFMVPLGWIAITWWFPAFNLMLMFIIKCLKS